MRNAAVTAAGGFAALMLAVVRLLSHSGDDALRLAGNAARAAGHGAEEAVIVSRVPIGEIGDDAVRVARMDANPTAAVSHIPHLPGGEFSDDSGRIGGGIKDGAEITVAGKRPAHLPGNMVTLGKFADAERPRKATYEVLFIAPNDQRQAEAIFKDGLTLRDTQNAVAQAASARRRIMANVPHTSPMSKADLVDNLVHTESNFISIIGHNERGVIILPDGTEIHLNDLALACDEAGKVCIFLSCNSRTVLGNGEIGTHIELSYGDAISISNNLERHLAHARDGKISSNELRGQLQTIINGSEIGIATADVTRPITIASASIGGVGLIVIKAGGTQQKG